MDTGTRTGTAADAKIDAGQGAAVGAKPVPPQAPAKNVPPVMPPQSELKPPGEVPAKKPAAENEGEYK